MMRKNSINRIPNIRPASGQAGTGMVEVLIASGIMAVVLVTVIGVYHSLAALSMQNTEKIQSAFLLEEGVEAIRIMRDSGWTSNIGPLSVNQTYYFRLQGGVWQATTTPQIVDEFERRVVVSDVYRDGSFNIVNSGGTLDANSRKALISVSWSTKSGTSTISAETYVFNTFNN